MKKRKKWHDLKITNITNYEINLIKSDAITKLVATKENSNVKAIIEAFLGWMEARGYKVKRFKREEYEISIDPGETKKVAGYKITNNGRVTVFIDRCANARTLCAQMVHITMLELE